ncbi:hypothetical protein FA95DRAFT_508221 [Auriscalpium vulgare]|uniref:Uncharacterized protein n=1 Tax=Auriscalpium vulgare TaxID=40419 RepID=A0ACB8RFS8_9AGAM|nr:hypothetical protein FA95DRAFT_508221 [Auriscalpium vulgare]
MRCRPDDESHGLKELDISPAMTVHRLPIPNPACIVAPRCWQVATERAQDGLPRAYRMRSRAAMCASCRSRRRWWSWNRHVFSPFCSCVGVLTSTQAPSSMDGW